MFDPNQYNTYSTARNTAGLAYRTGQSSAVVPLVSILNTEIQGLFNQGRAAVLSAMLGHWWNCLPKVQYQGSGKKPLQSLYSHQVGLLSTGHSKFSCLGWVRLADKTNSLAMVRLNVSEQRPLSELE